MTRLSSIALAACLVCVAAPVAAAQQTLNGGSFSIVYDDALVGLFGTPSLVGNSVVWFPSGSPGFTAQSSAGIDLTNSTFALRVIANPGYQLSGFNLSEAGDYFFFGAPGTTSGVSVSGQLRVTPLPGSTAIDSIEADSSFVANSFLGFGTRDWSASASLSLAPVSTANVSIENLLAAYVLGGTGYAFIEKKEVSLGIVATPIPEPSSYALLLGGLAGLGWLARRRRAV